MHIGIPFSGGSNPGRLKLKPPADTTDFLRKFIERSSIKSVRKYAKANLILRASKRTPALRHMKEV
ncbi:MAG TPA: hypothetical protein DEO65_14190 [Bacillus bacterium]|nr:hypothetical protein [Bacillus sp. (in: firmicutes)]